MYRIIVILIVASALSKVALRLKDGDISIQRFIAWTIVWLSVAVLGLMPQWSDFFTKILGVGRGADLFFFLAIMGLGYMLFSTYTQLQRMEQSLTELTRKLALRDLPKQQNKD